MLGAFNSAYMIFHQRRKNEYLSLFEKVDETIRENSSYLKLFKIFTWLGLIGYSLLAIIYYLMYLLKTIFGEVNGTELLSQLGFFFSSMGMILSYYLFFIQLSKFKKYCVGCLISTLLITIISALTFIMLSN